MSVLAADRRYRAGGQPNDRERGCDRPPPDPKSGAPHYAEAWRLSKSSC